MVFFCFLFFVFVLFLFCFCFVFVLFLFCFCFVSNNDYVQKLAEQVGIPYVETTATDAKSVKDAFTFLIGKVVHSLEHSSSHPQSKASGGHPKGKEDFIVS
jgi:hypothetical protein